MSFASQNRRHHVMSPSAQAIATKALESLASDKTAADALRKTASVENPLQSGRVVFAECERLGFSDVGFGLYTLASNDPLIPTVWQKEVVHDPVTGKQTEWLVVYTTDDENIVRETAAALQTTASASATLRSVAEGPKKDVPIAPGVVTKNLTLDQGGQGGTAKVTVEFNDPQKGEEFFKQVEEMAGGVGGTESAPAEKAPEEEGAEAPTAPEAPDQAAAPVAAGEGAPVAQPPTPQAPPMAMSSIRTVAEGLSTANTVPHTFGEFLRALQPGQLWKVSTPQQQPMYLYLKSPAIGRFFYFRTLPTMNFRDFSDEAVQNIESAEFKDAVMWPVTAGTQPPATSTVQPHVMWNSNIELVENGAAQTPMASTIRNLTHFGSKIATIIVEDFKGFAPVYSYVNEDGTKVVVPATSPLKVGAIIRRPDTGELIRVGSVKTVNAMADDEAILASLMTTAVDVSDQVPPMGWTNSQSQNEMGEGGQQPLPPNPALQQGAPPTADTSAPPLYDSTSAPAAGDKQKFQMSVDPNDNSVTVKFDKPPALDAIDQAVQGAQPPMGGTEVPPPSGTSQPAPMSGQPKEDFAQTENPTQF